MWTCEYGNEHISNFEFLTLIQGTLFSRQYPRAPIALHYWACQSMPISSIIPDNVPAVECMVGDDPDDEPISRRHVLKGAAVGVTGTIPLGHQIQTRPRSQTENQIQSQTTTEQPQRTTTTSSEDQSSPPSLYLTVVDSNPGTTDSYTQQTEFERGAIVYPFADVYGISHDNEIRMATQWHVTGGAGLLVESSDETLTNSDTDSWNFWLQLDTEVESLEGEEWTQGWYTVYFTVTDFITKRSTTANAEFRIT